MFKSNEFILWERYSKYAVWMGRSLGFLTQPNVMQVDSVKGLNQLYKAANIML